MTNWRSGACEDAAVRPCQGGEKADDERACVIHQQRAPGKSLPQHPRSKPSAPVTCHASKCAADRNPKINWHRKSVLLLARLKGRSRNGVRLVTLPRARD